MAGTTTPDLVASMSNAGGLVSHGCAALPVEKLEADMIALANRTNRPTNLNFDCHHAPAFDDDAHQALIGSLAPFFPKQVSPRP